MDVLLEQKQVQKLSPQMIQSMEILQMGTAELREYIEDLLLENPVLEREEDIVRQLEPAGVGARTLAQGQSGLYQLRMPG